MYRYIYVEAGGLQLVTPKMSRNFPLVTKSENSPENPNKTILCSIMLDTIHEGDFEPYRLLKQTLLSYYHLRKYFSRPKSGLLLGHCLNFDRFFLFA